VAHPRILIAGGGIGGLTAAFLLIRRGRPEISSAATRMRGSSVREHHEWLYSHDATAAPL
jgi:glycine/D-amino acid oxidase-like deaminating enzyme